MAEAPSARHCMIVFNQYPLGETRVQREAEALLRDGYKVDVICKQGAGEPSIDTYKGVRIFRQKIHVRLPFVDENSLPQRFLDYLWFLLSAFARLNKLHAKHQYSSVQVHNLPDFLVFCAIWQKINRVPVILDLHDLMPEFYDGRFGSSRSLAVRLIRWQERISCRFADYVITVSEHWRQALIERGVPGDKCSVVINVADSSIFHPGDILLRNPRKGTEFQLIYHGSMVYRYGIDLAVQSIDRLRDQIPGIHLVLIGQGDFLPELISLIRRLNLMDRVSIEPKRLAEELPGRILSCDLGLVPYRNDVFTDGLLPTKLMEYAALGLPAIASRTTAIDKYFSGANVEFFEPGNLDDLVSTIRRLYYDPTRLRELRQGCQIFNNRYNWDLVGAEYINILRRLTSRGNPLQAGPEHISSHDEIGSTS